VIAVAVFVAASAERTEAGVVSDATTSVAAVTQPLDRLAGPPPARAVVADSLAAPTVAEPLASIAPNLIEPFDEVVEPPILEGLSSLPAERRVSVAAIEQAGPPPQLLSRVERRAAMVATAAERGDELEVIESPFGVTLSQNPVLTASPPLAGGDVIEATISFYYCEQGDTEAGGDGGGFCGAMRDGTVVYEGAAACAYTYLGQQFRVVGDPTGRLYTCHDTGSAVHGLHRDIFFHSASDGWPWLRVVGTRVMLEIVG
jgi:hypothetical protein